MNDHDVVRKGSREAAAERRVKQRTYAGSYPPRLSGWHRMILHKDFHPPRNAPCLFKASIAYWLQDGWNRQCPPSNRPSVTRYNKTSWIKSHFMTVEVEPT